MTKNLRLLVGLGNPGEEYELTRHNIGFMFLDSLASHQPVTSFENDKYTFSSVLKSGELLLAKPLTFMNASGKAVKALIERFEIDLTHVYVIHDDLDLKIGEYKIQFGRGPKDHNGINSIEETLKIPEFWRVRIGIDNRDPYNRIPGENYVLQKFEPQELDTLRATFTKVVAELDL